MDKLSLDGLNFETICLEVDRKILTITLNRPEKKNAMNNVMTVSYTHLTLPTTPYV